MAVNSLIIHQVITYQLGRIGENLIKDPFFKKAGIIKELGLARAGQDKP